MPKFRSTLGTGWFLAILVISAVTAVYPINPVTNALILAICGAAVAIENIRVAEERTFLLAVTALTVVIIGLIQLVPMAASLSGFFTNLLTAFGIAGFVVALSEIAKIGLTR